VTHEDVNKQPWSRPRDDHAAAAGGPRNSAQVGSASRRERADRIALVEDDELDPAVAALELAAIDRDNTDLAAYFALLCDMVNALSAVDLPKGNLRLRACALAIVIGARFGFLGEREIRPDSASADMIEVFDCRRGPPVSMAILYASVARRVGLQAEAMGGNGEVLLRVSNGDGEVILNPFNAGMLAQADARWGSAHGAILCGFEPLSNRALLAQLLINDAVRAEAAGDFARAAQLFERLTVTVPENVEGWFALVRFKMMLDDVPDVRGDLAALLEITRDPGLRAAPLKALAAWR
jgi:regulator of sirC expression with transglutaminase-like and TPR domain